MKIVRGKDKDYIPASHEDPQDPGVLKKVLVTSQDLVEGQIMMINWALLPKGKAFEPHYHEDLQEVFIILSGKAEIKVGETSDILEKGDLVIIESREVHIMENVSDSDVEYIALGISQTGTGKTINV